MALCISDKQRWGGGGNNRIKGFYKCGFFGAVARQFSTGMVCYTRTAIYYGYFIALKLEESSGAL